MSQSTFPKMNLLDFTPEVLKIIFNNIKELNDLIPIRKSHPYLYDVISEHTEEISSSSPKFVDLGILITFPHLHKINELLYVGIRSFEDITILTTHIKHLRKANFIIIIDNIDIFMKMVSQILESYYDFEYFGFIFIDTNIKHDISIPPRFIILESNDKSCTFNTGETLLKIHHFLDKIEIFYSLYDLEILNPKSHFICIGCEIYNEPRLLDDSMFEFIKRLNLMTLLETTLNMTYTRITNKVMLTKILKLYIEYTQKINIDYTTSFHVPLDMFNALHIDYRLNKPYQYQYKLTDLETISLLYTYSFEDMALESRKHYNTYLNQTGSFEDRYNDILYLFNPINIGKFIEDKKVLGY